MQEKKVTVPQEQNYYFIFRKSFTRNGKTYRRPNGRPYKIKVKLNS